MICENCGDLATLAIFVDAHADPEWTSAGACCECVREVFRKLFLLYRDECGFRELRIQPIRSN
jgi:hypothetical protein